MLADRPWDTIDYIWKKVTGYLFLQILGITAYSTGHHVQRVTVNERFVVVEDPQVRDFVIDRKEFEGLYYELATTDAMYRAGGISQLCKDEASSTIPNAASFNRAWHVRALGFLADYYSEKAGLDPEVRLAIHLSQLDDLAHMEFSHATEPMVQRWGGPENYHEIIWPDIARLGGVTSVLDKHNIKYDEQTILIPGVKLPGWARPEKGEVGLDQLQYAITEMLLWYDNDAAPPEAREAVRLLCSLDNLEITDDGRFAFSDPEIGLLFAKGYLLLSTEHWNDPINRVQLHLLIQATQRAIVNRRIAWMDEIDKGETRKPHYYLAGIDQNIVDAMDTGPGRRDDFMYAVKNALYPIAIQERQRYRQYKVREYGHWLVDNSASDYPSEFLRPRRVDFGPPSSQVAIEMRRPAEGESTGHKIPILDEGVGIHYRLSPLKNRYIDPLVKYKGKHVKLSTVKACYSQTLNAT